MREMIDNYLAFARGEKEEKIKNINIYKLIKTLCEKDIIYDSKLLKTKLKKFTLIKPLAMKRALLNIISNAISYSKNIVEIILKMIISLIFLLKMMVRNSKNKREEVFKAFYRIDESRQSASANTGLGLTIAKDIIQGHGGRLLNTSNLGGLKVEITLPIKVIS